MELNSSDFNLRLQAWLTLHFDLLNQLDRPIPKNWDKLDLGQYLNGDVNKDCSTQNRP